MPIPEDVTLRVRINSGAWQTGPIEGGIAVAANNVVELSIANTSGVSKYRYEILDYPPGVALPSGWTQQANSRVRYNTTATPPTFTIPNTAGLFGRWILSVTVNDGKRRGTDGYIAAPELTDNSIGLNLPSATDLWDTPLSETNQFSSTLPGGMDAHKHNLRVLENAGLSGGAANPTGGSNQGSGVGVFKNKTTGPDTLNFKTLIQSTDTKFTWTAVGADEVRGDYNSAHLLPLAGGTMTGPIAMGTNKVTGAGEPTAAQDVATKNYVDNRFSSLVAGLGSIAGQAPTAIYLGDDAPAPGAFNTWAARNGAPSLVASGNPQAGANWGGSRTVNMDGSGDRYNANALATVHSSDADLALTILVPFIVTAGTAERMIVAFSNSANSNTEKSVKLVATSKFLRMFIQNDGATSSATATGAVAVPEGSRAILGLTFSGTAVTATIKTESGYVVHLNNVAMSAVAGAFTVDRFAIGSIQNTGSARELASQWRGFVMWNGHSVSPDKLKELIDYFEYALGAELRISDGALTPPELRPDGLDLTSGKMPDHYCQASDYVSGASLPARVGDPATVVGTITRDVLGWNSGRLGATQGSVTLDLGLNEFIVVPGAFVALHNSAPTRPFTMLVAGKLKTAGAGLVRTIFGFGSTTSANAKKSLEVNASNVIKYNSRNGAGTLVSAGVFIVPQDDEAIWLFSYDGAVTTAYLTYQHGQTVMLGNVTGNPFTNPVTPQLINTLAVGGLRSTTDSGGHMYYAGHAFWDNYALTASQALATMALFRDSLGAPILPAPVADGAVLFNSGSGPYVADQFPVFRTGFVANLDMVEGVYETAQITAMTGADSGKLLNQTGVLKILWVHALLEFNPPTGTFAAPADLLQATLAFDVSGTLTTAFAKGRSSNSLFVKDANHSASASLTTIIEVPSGSSFWLVATLPGSAGANWNVTHRIQFHELSTVVPVDQS